MPVRSGLADRLMVWWKRSACRIAVLCLVSLFLSVVSLSPPATARSFIPSVHAVIWSEPKDAYYELAREIASAEGLPLADALDTALAYDSEFLIWVVSPERLSEEVFSDLGSGLQEHGKVVSLGLISGSTIDMARALWQRRPGYPGRQLSIVPREEYMEASEDGQMMRHPLTIANAVAQIERADYVMFDGHGSPRHWRLNDTSTLDASDLPLLSSQVVAAGACQTFKLWSQGSIALAFADRGAAAYVGFLHSPLGYLIGDPKGFPLLHTWPEFPFGHVVQVQNRGLERGFLAWPYYLLLGDPRLALQSQPPYRVRSDVTLGGRRVLGLANAPAGVIPVRIPGGADYSFVSIAGAGSAWTHDAFYSAGVQMADIGADKYLLLEHEGGQLDVRLYTEPPWLLLVLRLLAQAFDHVTVIQHAQGSVALGWVTCGLPALVTAWAYLTRRPHLDRSLVLPTAAGLMWVAMRGGYALARRPYLVGLYDSWLRTMDEAFEISIPVLITCFITAACGTWLYLNVPARWSRSGGLLGILLPNWVIAAFWFGLTGLVNALAYQRYGFPLYGHGGGLMPLIACAVEGGLAFLLLPCARRLAYRSQGDIHRPGCIRRGLSEPRPPVK